MIRIALGTAVAVALCCSAPASATPWPDEPYFLQRLTEEGITYSDPAAVISWGYTICSRYEAGWSDSAVMHEIAAYNPALNAHGVAVVSTLAQFALCPQTLPPAYRDNAIARGTLIYAR